MASCISEEQQKHAIEYDGHWYATLDFAPPSLEEWTAADRDFRPLPEGWEVAPDEMLVQREVVGALPWGSACLVVSSGEAYSTRLWMNGGSKVSNFELESKGEEGQLEYRPRRCLASRPSRVLIRTPCQR
mmetsp:Transcript_142969/g.444569  ORF Transcript_142969/g.444569 Transcript_142969/m.444569 type:complete len:130 (-) Transcript_142969:22-411(-)